MTPLFKRKPFSLIISAVLMAYLSGCATTTQDSVSGVKRTQLLLLPESQVTNMSTQAYTQTLQDAEKKKTLNANKVQLERVRKISNRLIAQVGVFRPDATQWKWEINVENNDELNAYCMPGGKIMVYSGLMDKLKATDDELAAVIGHEIAHALREHGRERMSQAYVQQFGLQALGAVLSSSAGAVVGNASMQAANMGSQLFFALPNGREQEREADRIGLELAARAGYNPDAAVTLWQKMEAQAGATPPEFLSTHPASASRIAELRALAPKVRPLYNAAKTGK
ncbi:M48 family metallopeptidase [Methylotenera mobilis]|uniref:Peptidase M48 Ste24p n=1 Tax=Methylotenera mobilis (strain JLW8 / ATCC BAA-1282 / DSM 17540) TaxID=583345 RepID=C6WUL2_METML|nr:M48 family metallopeptidase [Methylotenera mobilis]ACT47611.1 peptidase M48 Ste24p [Methylotenera mobilis JLW8]